MLLNYQTVTLLLKSTLETLMVEPLFAPFRLVGGTNLSLRFGHRFSDDIDMFTDAEYRSLDYRTFEDYLKKKFPYYYCTDDSSIVGFGRGYYVGNSKDDFVKVDLMYSDPFLHEPEEVDGIRLASVEDKMARIFRILIPIVEIDFEGVICSSNFFSQSTVTFSKGMALLPLYRLILANVERYDSIVPIWAVFFSSAILCSKSSANDLPELMTLIVITLRKQEKMAANKKKKDFLFS